MLELAILGLLKEQPLHGYELKKRLGETLGALWGISYGSLYPALRRLERDGAIEGVDRRTPLAAPMPATGSLDGDLAAARVRRRAAPSRPPHPQGLPPHRRAARRGSRSCCSTTTTAADDERTFAMKLAFCRHLDPDGSARAARAPPAQRARRPPGARAQRSRPGRGDRYTRSLFEHRTQSTATRSRVGRRAHRG